MSFLEQQFIPPFSSRTITVKHALLHTLYWILIAAFFAYEKRYLIYKANLPYFLICVTGRVFLLVAIAYLNIQYFLPKYFMKKQYLHYVLLVLLSVAGYMVAQSLFDYFLYGYVIGPMRNSNLMETMSYNFFSTIWYLALMVAVKLSIDWYELQNKPTETADTLPEFVFVKSGTQKIKIIYSEVTHIEGLKDYAIAHTTSNQKIVIKGSIKYMSEIFPEALFIRVHKSFIVAKDKIRQIEKNKIIINEHQIPIGRSFKEELGKHLLNNNFAITKLVD
jgi:DNA-binding LytR/AlgR family response regulator